MTPYDKKMMVERREEKANDHILLALCRVAFSNHPRLYRFHVRQHIHCKQKVSQQKLFQKLHSSTQLPVKALTGKICKLLPTTQCMTLRSFTHALQKYYVAFMPHSSTWPEIPVSEVNSK